ncbi:MAG: hypothetical protein KDE51_16145, partial [Anaerolineales bacterium]|nr:hypothetical protein [Anaerolineales bacterium]
MKDKHKYIIMTITIVMGALLYIWQFIRDANSCQDAIAPRSIASSTQFNHLWSIDNLYIQTYKDNWGMVSNTLFTNNKDAFAIGAVESCEEHLLAVNSRGEISSIFTLKSSGNNRVTNILNDDLNLYTAYSSVFRVSGDDELGAGGIASYDLKSGQQNWDTPIPGA